VQGIFRDGVCCAAGRATLACIDLQTRKAKPVPEEAIARLSQWKYRGG
jgi:acyl-CoA thioesterase FadM